MISLGASFSSHPFWLASLSLKVASLEILFFSRLFLRLSLSLGAVYFDMLTHLYLPMPLIGIYFSRNWYVFLFLLPNLPLDISSFGSLNAFLLWHVFSMNFFLLDSVTSFDLGMGISLSLCISSLLPINKSTLTQHLERMQACTRCQKAEVQMRRATVGMQYKIAPGHAGYEPSVGRRLWQIIFLGFFFLPKLQQPHQPSGEPLTKPAGSQQQDTPKRRALLFWHQKHWPSPEQHFAVGHFPRQPHTLHTPPPQHDGKGGQGCHHNRGTTRPQESQESKKQTEAGRQGMMVEGEDLPQGHSNSTAPGGGGSFKDRKPYRRGELSWCMDGRANPLMERQVAESRNFSSLFVSRPSLSNCLYLPTYIPVYLPVCLSIYL